MIVGSFRQYDYGFIKNVFKYGNNKPPEYNLAVVTSPVSMIIGPNDWLATPEVSKSYSHLLYSKGLQTFLSELHLQHTHFIYCCDCTNIKC